MDETTTIQPAWRGSEVLQKAGTLICGLLAVLMGLQFFTPNIVKLNDNLDASHQWVLAWAYLNGYQWGSDILFTYGPMGFLRSRAYFPEMGVFEQLLMFTYSGLIGYLLWRFLRLDTAPVRSSLIVLPAIYLFFCFVQTYDQLILFLYLAGGYYLLTVDEFPVWDVFLVLVFFVLNFYLKYTFALLTVALIVMLFAACRIRRKAVSRAIGLLLGIGIAGILIDHWPWDIAAYLWNTWPIATGFSRSMMEWGESWEWITFLILSCLASLGFYLHLWKHRSLSDLIFFAIWCTGTGLLVWKQSFVRHDAHALGAGSYLLLMVCFYIKGALEARKAGGKPFGNLIAYGLTLCGFATAAYSVLLIHQYPDVTYASRFLRNIAHHSPHRLPENLKKAFDYPTLNQRYADRVKALAKANPLPPTQGAVDFYNARAGLLLAHGVEYKPRPVFQSYSAYTPGLIRKNRDFLTGDQAPDQLITDQTSVDWRPIMLEDGLSWLEILKRYQPVDREEEILLWEKAESDGTLSLELLEAGEGLLGEPIPLEAYSGEMLWIEMDVDPSWEGKLQNLLFKPSPLEIEYHFPDGGPTVHRVPPGMLKTGFLLSPYIKLTDDMVWLTANMGAGQPLPFLHFPDSIRLEEDRQLLRSYGKQFTYRLYRLRVEALPLMESAYLEKIREELITEGFRAYHTMEYDPTTGAPNLHDTEALGIHLFAHAECRFTLANPNPGGKVSIEYGLKDASWEGENATDGVIFRIYALSGDEQRLIFEDAITPKTEKEDRGRQKSIIKLPAGAERILLETHPRETANWDWSYWGPIIEIKTKDE